MKTTNKITIVSLAGALALIGTAFAAWQFNASATETKASNVEVTAKTSTGTIADVASFYLTLDQSGAFWTSKSYDGSESAILDADKVTSFPFVYTGSDSSSDVSDVELTVTFTVDEGIETYVTFTGGELVSVTESGNQKSGTYTLPTLSYTASKPTTSAAYSAMKTALEGKKVTFTLTAEVSE